MFDFSKNTNEIQVRKAYLELVEVHGVSENYLKGIDALNCELRTLRSALKCFTGSALFEFEKDEILAELEAELELEKAKTTIYEERHIFINFERQSIVKLFQTYEEDETGCFNYQPVFINDYLNGNATMDNETRSTLKHINNYFRHNVQLEKMHEVLELKGYKLISAETIEL